MKILVLGASSYLGARIFFDLKDVHEVTGTYSKFRLSKSYIQLDVTKRDDVNKLIGAIKPDVIIHAANNADPRWCLAHPSEALSLNQTATEFISSAAKQIDSKIIYISSIVAYEPTTLYSQTKVESEKIIANSTDNYVHLRPAFVLGYSPNTKNDRPFNRLLKNIDEKTPAIYDTSWVTPMGYVGLITSIIKEVINKDLNKLTIPIFTEEKKSRFEIARDILGAFNIAVIPIDKKDHSTSVRFPEVEQCLKKLGLPYIGYEEMVPKIIQEIKDRKKYTL